MKKKATVDWKNGLLYFDIRFEDFNLEEDIDNQNEDEDAARRVKEFTALGGGDLTTAARKAEDIMISEMSRLLGKRMFNEGHNAYDSLVCKVSVDSKADLQRMVDAVGRRDSTINDGIVLSNDVDYMSAQGWSFYTLDRNGLEREADGFQNIVDLLEENE